MDEKSLIKRPFEYNFEQILALGRLNHISLKFCTYYIDAEAQYHQFYKSLAAFGRYNLYSSVDWQKMQAVSHETILSPSSSIMWINLIILAPSK